MTINLYTIGFSKKNLRKFVDLLESNNVEKLVDTRLNNTSQLAGYSKKDDLEYVMELRNIEYVHEMILAPNDAILKAFKNKEINWEVYKKKYTELLNERMIIEQMDSIISGKTICLLCSEHKPDHCHRRVLAEYINENYGDINIIHLT